MQIRVKPDTASPRVLCIDGGGTRGKYPLKFLKQLEDDIGLPGHPVQKNFDVVFGTSSGAISAGALCINGWTVDECIARFESLSNQAFTPRGVPSIPIIGSFVSVATHRAALRDMFGSERSIADYSAADTMGAMVGMTVATVQDASACIFTNYNGLFHALVYRRPRHVPRRRPGGQQPSAIALQEVASLFPETPDPSLLASAGTGSSREEKQLAREPNGGWRDYFPFRLARAFRTLRSDKNAWQRLVAHKKVGRSGEFFRFDVEFDGPEPPLDSLSSFDDPECDDECTFEGLRIEAVGTLRKGRAVYL
ncbi:calcium-independent phospholipase A2-gamma [Colletotrichum liriopes]|uniref:Calcium-independent phospholipase A2-gamma n=1 Tax=Colletotrichum liriopes TaxID=708192 RepID=A0AA37H1A5_9PEZI|nr:calcium-independent phospholipase A2-gamma [Colletotrichum liriopes]